MSKCNDSAKIYRNLLMFQPMFKTSLMLQYNGAILSIFLFILSLNEVCFNLKGDFFTLIGKFTHQTQAV